MKKSSDTNGQEGAGPSTVARVQYRGVKQLPLKLYRSLTLTHHEVHSVCSLPARSNVFMLKLLTSALWEG